MPVKSTAIWVVLCNPENRRFSFFREALEKGAPHQLILISYEELLQHPSGMALLAAKLSGVKGRKVYIKIESPGENFLVTKHLIALGAEELPSRITSELAMQLPFDKGRFGYLHEWYLGFRKLLGTVSQILDELAVSNTLSLAYLNTPSAVLSMLDKHACQRFLEAHNISTPKLIPVIEDFSSWVGKLIEKRCFQVFIKPKYGSSAAGVIALRIKPDGNQFIARTSLELVKQQRDVRCYNSLKVRTYSTVQEIEMLYDTVMREGAYAEQWLPKAQINGKSFDLRVVVINGKATHSVTRCSHSPMTNLHLGNQRCDVLEHEFGRQMSNCAYETAEQAAVAFPEARCFGADVIVSPKRARIIELNAFGDLLPGIEHKGKSTYDAQVEAMIC